jgi:hypothetical protein
MNNEFRGVGGIQLEVEPLRTYDYEKAFGAVSTTAEYPSYFIIPTSRMGVIKNQGNVGCCVGCVMSSLAEVFEKIEAEKDGRNLEDTEVEFSEGWAYGALRDATHRYWGMYPTLAMEHWRQKGMLPKKYFNFLEEMPMMRKKVDTFPELYEKAVRYKINSYVSLNYANKQKRDLAIKEAIFNRNYGLLSVSTEYFGESHCIMIVGWNDEKDKYIIKNSWGEKWNGNGLAEIPKNEIDYVYLVTDEELGLPFKDVKNDAWYYGDIKNVYLGNLMNGISDTEFCPLQNVTRAEFSTILGRLVNLTNEKLENIVKILKVKYNRADTYYNSSSYLLQKVKKDKMQFTDVPNEAWYYKDIINAYEYGLINGKSEHIFDPEAPITRAEIATLIIRICDLFLERINYILKRSNKKEIKKENNSINFQDVLMEDWFYTNIKAICNLGIMNGKSEKNFEPNAFTTRAETATVINRLSKYIDAQNFLAIN